MIHRQVSSLNFPVRHLRPSQGILLAHLETSNLAPGSGLDQAQWLSSTVSLKVCWALMQQISEDMACCLALVSTPEHPRALAVPHLPDRVTLHSRVPQRADPADHMERQGVGGP